MFNFNFNPQLRERYNNAAAFSSRSMDADAESSDPMGSENKMAVDGGTSEMEEIERNTFFIRTQNLPWPPHFGIISEPASGLEDFGVETHRLEKRIMKRSTKSTHSPARSERGSASHNETRRRRSSNISEFASLGIEVEGSNGDDDDGGNAQGTEEEGPHKVIQRTTESVIPELCGEAPGMCPGKHPYDSGLLWGNRHTPRSGPKPKAHSHVCVKCTMLHGLEVGFPNHAALELHMKIKNGPFDFRCRYMGCEKEFAFEYLRAEHIKTDHRLNQWRKVSADDRRKGLAEDRYVLADGLPMDWNPETQQWHRVSRDDGSSYTPAGTHISAVDPVVGASIAEPDAEGPDETEDEKP